jgi:hypothetical protein
MSMKRLKDNQQFLLVLDRIEQEAVQTLQLSPPDARQIRQNFVFGMLHSTLDFTNLDFDNLHDSPSPDFWHDVQGVIRHTHPQSDQTNARVFEPRCGRASDPGASARRYAVRVELSQGESALSEEDQYLIQDSPFSLEVTIDSTRGVADQVLDRFHERYPASGATLEAIRLTVVDEDGRELEAGTRPKQRTKSSSASVER